MAIERTGVPERRCRTKAPVPNQSSVHCSVHSVVYTSVGNGVLRGSCDPATVTSSTSMTLCGARNSGAEKFVERRRCVGGGAGVINRDRSAHQGGSELRTLPRREWLSRGCPGGMQLSRRLGGGGKQRIDPRVCSDRIGRTVVTQVREGYEAQWSFSPYTDTDLLRAVARRRIVSEWWGKVCSGPRLEGCFYSSKAGRRRGGNPPASPKPKRRQGTGADGTPEPLLGAGGWEKNSIGVVANAATSGRREDGGNRVREACKAGGSSAIAAGGNRVGAGTATVVSFEGGVGPRRACDCRSKPVDAVRPTPEVRGHGGALVFWRRKREEEYNTADRQEYIDIDAGHVRRAPGGEVRC